jgi:THO complex subunit 1
MQNYLTKTGKQIVQNKSIQYQYTLTDEQFKWTKEKRDLIKDLLEVIEPNGYEFTKTIFYILKHEKNMIKWKAESCRSYEKPEMLLQNKIKRQKTNNIPVSQFSPVIVNPVLKELFKESSENVLRSLSDESRNVVPTIEEFLEPLKLDLELEVDPQDRCTASSEYCWKALRIASRHHLNIIQKSGKADVESFYSQLLKEKEQKNENENSDNQQITTEDENKIADDQDTEMKDEGDIENEDLNNSINDNESNKKEMDLESSLNETSNKEIKAEGENTYNDKDTNTTNYSNEQDETKESEDLIYNKEDNIEKK